MNVLFRNPNPRNKRSGNITMSHDEYEKCLSGYYGAIDLAGYGEIPIESWMTNSAVDKGDYILFPLLTRSSLR